MTTMSKMSRALLRTTTTASRRLPAMAVARPAFSTLVNTGSSTLDSTNNSKNARSPEFLRCFSTLNGGPRDHNNEKPNYKNEKFNFLSSKVHQLYSSGVLNTNTKNNNLAVFLLQQLAQSQHSEAATQAQELIAQLHQEHGYVTDEQYCLALEVCAKQQDNGESSMKSLLKMVQEQQAREEAHHKILQEHARQGNGLSAEQSLQEWPRQDIKSLLYVMEAWARSSSSSEEEDATPERIQVWVDRVLEASRTKPAFPSLPSKMEARAYAMAGNVDKVEELLTNMNWEYQEANNLKARPDLECFHWALMAYTNNNSPSLDSTAAAERAEAILDHMKLLFANRFLHVDPTNETYQLVLQAYAKAKNGTQADQLFEKMMDDFKEQQGKEHVTTRTLPTLNAVLEAWSDDEKGATAALEIMKLFYKVGLMRDAPNETSYALVMKSVLKSGKDPKAMKLDILGLVKQAQRYLEGEEPKDEMEIFMDEFKSTSNSAQEETESSNQMEDSAPKTYRDMLPNGDSNRMFTLPTTQVSTQEAEVLLIAKTELERLQHQYCGGEITYECVQDQMQAIRHFLPDKKEIRARAIGELVLTREDTDSTTNGQDHSVAQSSGSDDAKKGAAHVAHDEMRNMLLNEYMGKHEQDDESHEPTLAKFNTLLDAMARSGSSGAAERMQAIIEHMKHLHSTGKLDGKPDTFSYNSVIMACANAGNAARAQEVLEQMYHACSTSENNHMKPNLQSFSYAISAWARSGLPDGQERADFLLSQMREFLKIGVRKDSGILDMERAYIQSVQSQKEEAVVYQQSYKNNNDIELEARSPDYDGSK